MKLGKSTLQLSWLIFCIVSMVSGAIIAITSQLGDRFHTTILEQIEAGDTPIFTLIGISLVLLPLTVSFVLMQIYGLRK